MYCASNSEYPYSPKAFWQETAILLAGGQSMRMGCDKRFLPVAGRPLIQHVVEQLGSCFDEVLVAANDPENLCFLNVSVIPDAFPDRGPLAGIAAALSSSRHELNFVIACDIPDISHELTSRLLATAREGDGAIPVTVDGHLEPLFAVYHRRVLPVIENALEAGVRKITTALAQCDIRQVPLLAGEYLQNLNSIAEYTHFLRTSDYCGYPKKTYSIFSNNSTRFMSCK